MTREQAIKILMGYSHTPEERAAMETLIPELAESEDERIRRTLVEYFGPKVQLDFVRGIPIQKIRDWLEKQKDIEDRWIEDRGQCFWDGVEEGKMLAEKQKEQKPEWSDYKDKVNIPYCSSEPEWSEEDEKMLWNIISIVGQSKSIQADEMLDWLKSLRPDSYKNCNSRWKPSEEQDYSDLSDLERTIHRGFLCAGVENVPVAIIKETAKEVQTLKAEE